MSIQPNVLQTLAPVQTIQAESLSDAPSPGIALCLSGGGYRAMLFHLGTLWRLNELGYLPKLDRISSVSGGSITAGALGLLWSKLQFNASGVAANFDETVAARIRGLAGHTVDTVSILSGVLGPGSVGDKVEQAYRRYVFGNATLQDLPDRPRFVINSTNVQSMVLWRFSKPYMRDYRVGEVRNPTVPLAVAVAASSAFPPFLSPVVLKLKESEFTPGSGEDLQRPPFTTEVVLTDGGVYDNLGLETAWKRYDTVLVSDAGGAYQPESDPKRDWAQHSYRVFNLIDNQVRALRKRQVIASFKEGIRKGAYWGIRSNIADFRLPDALPCPFDKSTAIAKTATRLKALEAPAQQRLINWGYAVCDAAMRKHVDPSLTAPAGFPYPAEGVGQI